MLRTRGKALNDARQQSQQNTSKQRAIPADNTHRKSTATHRMWRHRYSVARCQLVSKSWCAAGRSAE